MPNIGPRERKKRVLFGAIGLVIAAGLLTLFVVLDVHRLWRLTLLLPFWAAALGYFQAREKT